jgi:polyisoprenoid-binding protein YceI
LKRLAATVVLFACWASLVHAAPRGVILDQSQIEFTVKQMGVPVTGKFKKFDAALDIDLAKPEKSSAAIRIDIGSLATDNDEADAIAVSADWLDKVRAPLAIFQSTSIRALSAGRFEAKGSLSLKSVARPITLQFASSDQADGKTVITSEFKINRSEFGIGAGVWNQSGVVAEVILVKVKLLLSPAGAKLPTLAVR